MKRGTNFDALTWTVDRNLVLAVNDAITEWLIARGHFDGQVMLVTNDGVRVIIDNRPPKIAERDRLALKVAPSRVRNPDDNLMGKARRAS